MRTNAKKRFLAWTLAFLMVFTYVPATAYATDAVDAAPVETAAEDVTPATETAPAEETSEAEASEPAAVPATAAPATAAPAADEDVDEEKAAEPATASAAGTEAELSVLDGKVSIYNDKSTGSIEDGVVTITATGKALQKVTNTVTITNKTDKTSTLSFDYKAVDYNSFSEANDNGSYSVILAAGESIDMYIESKTSSEITAVLTLSNFSLDTVADASELTFTYDKDLGSITVAGETVASGTKKTTTYKEGLALTAKAADGAEFLGWIDAATGKIFSRDAEFTLKPTKSADVEAVFINDKSGSYYLAGTTYIFTDLDKATAKAAALDKKVVTLLNDVTLTKGDHVIPAGVTLLVPFDDKNTLYTTNPKGVHGSYQQPKAYRTLTLADGANLIVKGALSLSANHNAANGGGRGSGAPTGNVSFMDMAKGSTLTVEDEAFLYAYGYIVGEGTVTAKDGATVYENFQIEDFRGGTITSNMATSWADKGVLPIAQYYVQNIEVPMTLEAGATEYCYTSLYISSMVFGSAVKFISSDLAMFNLKKGSVTKSYDGATDRLVVEGNGDMSLSPITVELEGQKINSKSFELPINHNITVKVNSGEVEINQDIALLPGAQIEIAKGAACTLGNGINVYVYDADQWGKYCGSANAEMYPVLYAPGMKYNRTTKDLVDASILVNGKLDAADGNLYTTTSTDHKSGNANIYSTGNGVVSIKSGVQEYTYQFRQNGYEGDFDNIHLLPANLVNADGKHVQTLDTSVGTYTYANGTWGCSHAVDTEKVTKDPTCTEDGLKTVTCKCDIPHTYVATIPAAHDLTAIDRKEPTCTEDGYTAGGQCKNCDYTENKEVLPATGHNETAVKDVKPTCTETGITGKTVCSVCETVINEGTVTEALGHDWDNGYVSVKPTVEKEGQMIYTCNECGTTRPEPIEKLKERNVTDYETFIKLVEVLENLAYEYTFTDKGIGKDPANLFIKYVRTGVDRYNSGSWQIMAGYEDEGFAQYVAKWEADYNATVEKESDKVYVTALKNLENFTLPSGDYVDLGHMFGTMDISYTNIDSVNHADVSGWAGDTTDLLSTADYYGDKGELEDCVDKIYRNYLCKSLDKEDIFSSTDMLGDMDGFYLIEQLKNNEYEKGFITKTMTAYFDEELSEEQRAKFFLENRLNCGTTREAVREAVYNAYTSNSVISTLEGTREFQSDEATLDTLRRACCYAFADYICRLAGDFVDITDNPYYEVYSTKFSNLAPGISQELKSAKTADNKEMMYYVATADITRDDVHVYANYASRPVDTDANGNYKWAMTRVLDQANNAQTKYGTPGTKDYIENYNVITAVNADGFNMTTGEPGGLLIMDGREYHGIDGGGFFGITKDGEAVLGTLDEYNKYYKDKLAEGVGGFGTRLVTDGKIAQTPSSDYYTNRASRTAVGITKTGKVVFLVVDGRQNSSVGGSMEEIAQIMMEAGCVEAINLDGGGSTTYVGRPEGSDELDVINVPSDGIQRSVSTTLMMVSTAPSSTAFDHAVLETATNYITKGSEMQVTAKGVSATGNSTDLPEDVTWAVSNDKAKISKDGVLTAVSNGTVDIQLKSGDSIVGKKTITVVVPDKVTFSKSSVNVVYGSSVALPVKAYYEGKLVTVNPGDFIYTIGNEKAGKVDGFNFIAAEGTDIRNTNVTLTIKGTSVSGTIAVRLYNQGEATFDFDLATGGTREFAWDRQVSNASPGENNGYYVDKEGQPMTTSYTFAIDMTQIPIPEKLEDLTYMLPGSDLPDACAWTFLCNLAGRISDLTEVTAVVDFDDNVDVEYKNVKIVTDYFKLNTDKTTFDEATNTLTLKMNWIRQFAAIDYEMANPICIVTGLKVTPKKDAKWDANNTLQITNKGTISYEAYMKASSLYTFANNPANQQRYDLWPYENDYIMINGDQDKGGKFGATYCNYSDTYSLINAAKKGWIGENGGQAYYKNGKKLTGIQLINGIYYDFGEAGWIKSRDDKYTGFITNTDKTYSYSRDGVLVGGWVLLDGEYYFFDYDTKKNLSGKHTLTVSTETQLNINSGTGKPKEYLVVTEDVEYEFDNKGKVTPRWFTNDEGELYYYVGPQCLCWKQGIEIDGKTYYFSRGGYVYRGLVGIQVVKADPRMYYIFDEVTGELIQKCEGFVEYKGNTYYYPSEESRKQGGEYANVELLNGRLTGFHQIDGKYYMFGAKSGVMQYGKKSIAEYSVEGGCQSLNFSKEHGGYAVDVNGKAITSLAHNHVETYIAPTTTAKGGWAMQCKNCGEISKWTKVETYKQVVNASTIKAKAGSSTKNETITLTWTKSLKDKMTRYTVYRSKTGKAGTFKKLGSTTAAKFVDKKATPGTKYYYKVIGVKSVNGSEYKTKWSNVVNCKVNKVSAAYIKGSAMTAKASYIGTGVKVTWEAPRVKASGYEVWRATSKNGKYTKIKTTTKLSVSNTGLKVGKVYWYKVRAYKISNGKKFYTKYSPKVSRKVLSKTNAGFYNSVNGVAGITSVKAAAVTGGIKVTWNKKAAVKANQYEVYRATSKNGNYTKIATVKTKSYTDKSKKLVKGKTYYYKVVGKRVMTGVTAKTKASAIVSAKKK